jgi:4-amino-4-deoxy-L-arabinose transferase-like glycosyltransferase
MKKTTCAEMLWGNNSKAIYLLLAATIMLFTLLGSREIWTQEHRWADIVYGMFYRRDFFHPYLNEVTYYDKPLLSYWLIAGFSFLTGKFSTWAMRLPSALAGLLAIWSIYRIGTILKDKRLGLLSGWILLTTFYFLFWAKTSSADMLNLGGILFAVCWYFEKRNESGFFNYAIFFLILALTSLCKGLVGMIVPLIVIFPDLIIQNNWKKHLHLRFFLAMIPAAIVYVLPFWASAHFGGENYGENGLYLVYRENILRYFQPFDHKGPIYTYFLYLPIYLIPWAVFFIPALIFLKSRWRNLSSSAKSLSWSVLLLFIFFTLSGSRRNYYILPMVPFAILMTADWILARSDEISHRNVWAGRVAIISFIIFFLTFDVMQPLYYAAGGTKNFPTQLKEAVTQIKPWNAWQFVMLDPESKTRFYLEFPPNIKSYAVRGKRENQTKVMMLHAWPMLQNKEPGVIFISRKQYAPLLRNLLPNYTEISATANLGERVLKRDNQNAPVAFVPPT